MSKEIKTESPAASAESVFIELDYVVHIWETIMEMSVKHREILILSLHHQMSMDEIASLLRISKGTVKSRLHRAKTKLAALLKEDSSYERS